MTPLPEPGEGPVLRVIDQHATDEEIAAIVAVVTSLAAAAPSRKRPRPLWTIPQTGEQAVMPSPSGWRASAFRS